MSTLENCLRCFRHPATLISIVLLLLNDHVFKLLYPSWATGKLSDFAGLFFFPFLMAAALGLGTLRLHWSVQRTGWIAFGLTGIWFALIKTTPWGNGFTQDIVSMLLGFRVQIILDPTDLIALLALLPAWRLWNRVEPRQPSPLAWGVLSLATLATIATSGPAIVPVMRVASADGIVSAELQGNTFAQSIDGGKTWFGVKSVADVTFQDKTQPVVLCDPTRASLCFRIAQKNQVDESNDGGKTWRVGWQIPSGREEYVRRIKCSAGACGTAAAWGPFDLCFLDQNGANTLIVAMGIEGVLVRTPDGNWQRYGVLYANPTPFQSTDVWNAFVVMSSEAVDQFYISVIFVLILSIGGWLLLLVRMGGAPASGRRRWAMRPILLALAIAVLGCSLYAIGVLMQLGIRFYPIPIMDVITVGVALDLVVGYVMTWMRLATLAAQPKKVWLTGCGVFAAFFIFPLGVLPFILWALGVLANYDDAQWMSTLLTWIPLVFAVFAVGFGSISAMRQRPTK